MSAGKGEKLACERSPLCRSLVVELRHCRQIGVPDLLGKCLCGSDDYGEKIVEVMGDPACQLSDRLQTLGLRRFASASFAFVTSRTPLTMRVASPAELRMIWP